jgi:hypothetical protein
VGCRAKKARYFRKAMVIVSDVGDNRSRYRAAKQERAARIGRRSTPWAFSTRSLA